MSGITEWFSHILLGIILILLRNFLLRSDVVQTVSFVSIHVGVIQIVVSGSGRRGSHEVGSEIIDQRMNQELKTF